MQTLAHKAYGEAQKRTADDKQIELALFRQITQSLELAAQEGQKSLTLWADAVHRNQQMWSVITSDILHPQNALPEETKKSLLRVAEFVRQHSMQVQAGTGEIADLIELNMTIMAGLSPEKQSTSTGDIT